ncbi:MAG: DUF1993 domain-containing protein [Pseudomonadota bacterium]|nr:DUF1993 domain-containing protein [Pseudomonadota bacterium]
MSISMYAASVPVFTQMLGGLSGLLKKAEAHAEQHKIEPEALLHARLFPTMFALRRQVQIACDFARGVSARLAGVEVPKSPDTEQTFAELQALITKTQSFIAGLSQSQFGGSESREIVTRPGTPKERRFNGQDYLLSYGLPQFFFHVTTAYALLRHNGIDLGKGDYMGTY